MRRHHPKREGASGPWVEVPVMRIVPRDLAPLIAGTRHPVL